MRAIVCTQWGSPEGLVLVERPSPVPAEGEARVRVHACGLNFADLLIIGGQYQVRPPLPFSPGFEVAGEILEVGSGVTHLQPGDRVAAFCDYGGYAEEVVVPADRVLPIPDEMDTSTAAAFIITYGTSHVALTRRARLQAGEVLLVHGAAGGVGLTAVEIGKLLGATVIATASTPEKLALVGRHGADHLINYSEEDFVQGVKAITNGQGADVIYDPVGGDVFDRSLRCISREGRLLVIGFASGQIPQLPVNLAMVKNISVVGFFWGGFFQFRPDVVVGSLQALFDWHVAGKIKPHIWRTFPLEEAAAALQALASRRSMGKVILTTAAG